MCWESCGELDGDSGVDGGCVCGVEKFLGSCSMRRLTFNCGGVSTLLFI